ncbi:MAG: CDP-alcohol phosphatidyltransferase family protein [Halieaceae bacterium]
MSKQLLRHLPNAFTSLRILLAAPICWLIIEQQYVPVLWLTLLAGISDALDGMLARRLGVTSRFGAIADPLADKILLGGAYLSFAVVGLLPWWVALVVLGRDLFIVAGALFYHWRFGAYEMDPSSWGKFSTFVQILFALMLLWQQVQPLFPGQLLLATQYAMVLVAFISAGHYTLVWGSRARAR